METFPMLLARTLQNQKMTRALISMNRRSLCFTPLHALVPLVLLSACVAASAQPQEPPIVMTQLEFNQGRPANFYYFVSAAEGSESVCAELLAALNEPYPAVESLGREEIYSKFLLRSRLSVQWAEIPIFSGVTGTRRPYDARYVRTDINNDGSEEDVILEVANLNSTPVHYFRISRKGEVQTPIKEISPEISIALRDGGSRELGERLAERIRSELVRLTRDSADKVPEIFVSSRNYYDILEFEGSTYILRTTQSVPEHQKDTFLMLWSGDDSLQSTCWLRSRYTIEDDLQ